MRPRFPGMDPWLEHPGLWPGVHNRFITAIADELGPKVAPKYYVDVEQHTYVTSAAGDIAVIRPDVLVGRSRSRKRGPRIDQPAGAAAGVIEIDVEVPVEVQVEE